MVAGENFFYARGEMIIFVRGNTWDIHRCCLTWVGCMSACKMLKTLETLRCEKVCLCDAFVYQLLGETVFIGDLILFLNSFCCFDNKNWGSL